MYAGLSPICEHCEQVLVYEESEYNSLTEDAVTEAQVSLQDVGRCNNSLWFRCQQLKICLRSFHLRLRNFLEMFPNKLFS